MLYFTLVVAIVYKYVTKKTLFLNDRGNPPTRKPLITFFFISNCKTVEVNQQLPTRDAI